jgi:translation initiation factor 2A
MSCIRYLTSLSWGLMEQVTWRPIPLSTIKVDPLAQPQIHSSALTQSDPDGNISTPTKPAGAYRPPHARGTATPAAFKREDEGGMPHINGTSSSNDIPSRERVVPGLAPSEPKEEKKRSRKKKDKSEKPVTDGAKPVTDGVGLAPSPPTVVETVPAAPEVSQEDLKKQRALLKKLRAIEELKLRQAGGEKLEKTQEQKIEKEMEIVQELANLGFTE